MKIDNYPVVKLLIPYVVGVVVSYYSDLGNRMRLLMLIFSGVFLLLTFSLMFIKSYRWRVVKTFVMIVAFLLTGILLTDMRLHPDYSPDYMENNDEWIVRVVEEPALRKKSVKVSATVLNTTDSKGVKAKILFYLKPTPDAVGLRYGDLLFIHTKLSRIPPPCNPDAFNNQQYMQRRGIFYSGYVNENAWKRIGNKPDNMLKYYSQITRNKLKNIYISTGMAGEELDILKAILLGDDDTLDPELKAAYSSAGVSHILCVSGMHVGVIFMIINFLLKPLDYFRSSRILKTIVIMGVIWLYAHITGLAPSVTRSATMFTFVAVGQLLRRNTNIFHSLFASLFILLIINPLLLFEVGFQLSYLAVAGITLFQPKLAALYHCKTRIGGYFWGLITVSVAAQLGTSPISIYYFAKFSNYFIVSNLCVIALSFAVIITGITLLSCSPFPFITQYVSWILTKEIRVMNYIIRLVEHLPFSVTKNIDYTIFQVILLYSVIGCICLLLYRGNRMVLWSASILFTFFCVSFSVRKFQLNSEKGFLAYNVRKCSAVGFSQQGCMILFSDSIRDPGDDLYRFNILNHVRKKHLQVTFVPIDTFQYNTPFLCKCGNYIRFNNDNYYILTSNQKVLVRTVINNFSIDCLLIRQNPSLSPAEMMAMLPFKEVVADGSNSEYYVNRWRVFCSERAIPFHYTGDEK